jgi:hypothetical protein
MRIAIAGAGNVGRAIARELLDNGHEVLLIDRDPKALKLDSVPDAQWLMADACEISSLDKAALSTAQVLVAATGDDKVNLVASLLAKTEYGVPRVVARINHPKNEWMFDSSWESMLPYPLLASSQHLSKRRSVLVMLCDSLALNKVKQTWSSSPCQIIPAASERLSKRLNFQMMPRLLQLSVMAASSHQRPLMYLAPEMNFSLSLLLSPKT